MDTGKAKYEGNILINWTLINLALSINSRVVRANYGIE